MKKVFIATLMAFSLLANTAMAHTKASHAIKVKIWALDPIKGNQEIGEVAITESQYGLIFTPALSNLPAGLHGFHIHEHASCDTQQKDGKAVAGLAAGGHWDPNGTKKHGYPWEDDVHLGDLPALTVNSDGTANNAVLAPRLKKLNEIKNHALMIHAGGDNHSDIPNQLGGGGARMACGVIN